MDTSNLFEAHNDDEYLVTALHIFDLCGVESTGTIPLAVLMDKLSPEKSNKSEFEYLKTLLDPKHENPDVNVTKLARALNEYSETQKTKVDFEDSFNLKTGRLLPQDSDSGISTDGFQLLEDLQCELREKTHLASKLRSQLDFTDRQNEEVINNLTAELNSLRARITMLSEENSNLMHVRSDYEEACERISGSEAMLSDARRDLDTMRRRIRQLQESFEMLENDNETLQQLLTKSKDECHRINEMYATRQAALLEENETLKSNCAELSSRFQDQEEFMQQILKDKVLVEMELKDVLNKSNQTHLRLDRSIDISYPDDQILSALDSLNADSHFGQQHLLNEESFLNALKEKDNGRSTNMSLFDEIRLSFCNNSRNNLVQDLQCYRSNIIHDDSKCSIGIQTAEEIDLFNNNNVNKSCIECPNTQMEFTNCSECDKLNIYIDKLEKDVCHANKALSEMKINLERYKYNLSKLDEGGVKSKHFVESLDMCLECETLNSHVNKLEREVELANKALAEIKLNLERYKRNLAVLEGENGDTNVIEKSLKNKWLDSYIDKLERDIDKANKTLSDMQVALERYEGNLHKLEAFESDENGKNEELHDVLNCLNAELNNLQNACDAQKSLLDRCTCEKRCVKSQTERVQASVSTQADHPCGDCERTAIASAVKSKTTRGFFWDAFKSLFQVFAVGCFCVALVLLYNVSHYHQASRRCVREGPAVPWRWLRVQDLLDVMFKIEYVGEVPM